MKEEDRSRERSTGHRYTSICSVQDTTATSCAEQPVKHTESTHEANCAGQPVEAPQPVQAQPVPDGFCLWHVPQPMDENDGEQHEKGDTMEYGASPATHADHRHDRNRWSLRDGCLWHPNCPVPVGIKGGQMNHQQAVDFLTTRLKCWSVLCKCGKANFLYNFALDDTKCSECGAHMAKPAGKKIELTETAIYEMPCECGAKLEWLTVHDVQSRLQKRRGGKKTSLNPADMALPEYFHQPKMPTMKRWCHTAQALTAMHYAEARRSPRR